MPDPLDPLAIHAQSKGYTARSRTVLVEGTTDYDLFELAARLERQASGRDLLSDLAFIPAGLRDDGGTNGVVRELLVFRAFANQILLPTGRPKYRVCALLDNDRSGRQAVKTARQFDIRIIECRDVFLLRPEMPPTNNRDPASMMRMLEAANARYKGLDWEPEDLLPESFIAPFERDHGAGISRKTVIGDKAHRDFTADGKARFHRFIRQNAMRDDMISVNAVLKSIRSYLGLT